MFCVYMPGTWTASVALYRRRGNPLRFTWAPSTQSASHFADRQCFAQSPLLMASSMKQRLVHGSLAAAECLKRMLKLCLICCMTEKSAPWVTLWFASGPTSPAGLAPAARSPSLRKLMWGCRTCDFDLCLECLLKSKHDPRSAWVEEEGRGLSMCHSCK